MDITDILNRLKSGRVLNVGRSADMFWMIIENGNQYAIDIQSPFRISYKNEIILTNVDMYLNDYEFSRKIDEVSSIFFPLNKIENVLLSKHNDLCILFSDDTILETFTNVSDNDNEQWRIFERHDQSEPHYVAYCDRIEAD